MRGGKQYGYSQGGWLELLGWCPECDLECRGESTGHVLDPDIFRLGVVEVQPLTGSRIDDVRFSGTARFHGLSVP